jgi:uncharacterized protein
MATIIFKATEACNSNCLYCQVVKRKQPDFLSYELLEILIVKINRLLQSNPKEHIKILWHGGEPLLLGVNYFSRTADLIDQYCKETKNRISHSIQTNLTLFTEEFVPIFKKLGIHGVGTSFDPVPNIRGFGKNQDSVSYNKKFIEAVRILKKHSIGWGFIYVTTRKSLGLAKEIFHFSTNFNNKKGMNIHPVDYLDESNSEYAINNDEFADFLGQIFRIWSNGRDRYGSIEPFTSYYKIYEKNERMTGCETSGKCAYSHLYIGPNGEASHCGRCGDIDAISYGNIKDNELHELLYHPKRKIFEERQRILVDGECKGCRFWDICRGGCPADSYHVNKSLMHRTIWCKSKIKFLEEYFEPVIGYKKNFHHVCS